TPPARTDRSQARQRPATGQAHDNSETQTSRAMSTRCTHESEVRRVEPRAGAGCEECLESGHEWIGLRLCLTCGHVGCCDASPHQHASKHFHATLHPIVEPFRSDEHWRWCYVDQVMLETPGEPWVTGVPGGNERAADSADPEPRAERRSGGLLSRVIGALHRDNYLVGVVDDPVSAERGANALRTYGFAADDV